MQLTPTLFTFVTCAMSFDHHSPRRCCLTQCLLTILAYINPVCHFSCFHVLINHHFHHLLNTVLLPPSLPPLYPVQLQDDPLIWINPPVTDHLPRADMIYVLQCAHVVITPRIIAQQSLKGAGTQDRTQQHPAVAPNTLSTI